MKLLNYLISARIDFRGNMAGIQFLLYSHATITFAHLNLYYWMISIVRSLVGLVAFEILLFKNFFFFRVKYFSELLRKVEGASLCQVPLFNDWSKESAGIKGA